MSARPTAANSKARPPKEAGHVRHTTESVVRLEQKERLPQSLGESLGGVITNFSGSLTFVCIHIVWFAAWMLWNSTASPLPVFDPFPYTFLTLVVSLEAIFLSTFVLISENRQSARAERRALLDLDVNVISERELTKILELVADIHAHVGAKSVPDPEIEEMASPFRLDDIEKSLDDAEARLEPSG